ncbi:MAG: 16S rRNA processing protein RimM [Myxococcales bacterium]|nr:16S rRNA processing protein RimM [Myxococcales bacterium]
MASTAVRAVGAALQKPAPEDWVPLAVVGRAHGVRGELRAHRFDRDSHLLAEVDEVLVRFVDGERRGEAHEVSVDSVRPGNDALLVKLHGVDDRDAADDVKGAHLCVKRSDFPPLADGEFYACDVVGAGSAALVRRHRGRRGAVAPGLPERRSAGRGDRGRALRDPAGRRLRRHGRRRGGQVRWHARLASIRPEGPSTFAPGLSPGAPTSA